MLEMLTDTLSMTGLVVLSIMALIAGFFSAIGGSSGMIILPLLLTLGIPPHIAMGTNKLYTTVSLGVSSGTFLMHGTLRCRHWLLASLASLLGAGIAAWLSKCFPEQLLQQALPIIISSMGIYFLLPKKSLPNPQTPRFTTQSNFPKGALGLALGIYSGIIGAGTGNLWTSSLMRFFGIDIVEASAISRFMCFTANMSACVTFILMRDINYSLGLLLAVLGSIGAYAGSKIMLQYGRKIIQPTLVFCSMFMATKLLVSSVL